MAVRLVGRAGRAIFRSRAKAMKMSVASVTLVILILSILSSAPSLKSAWPLRPLYMRYSKWRYNWRSADEMGNGKNAHEILIEGPMGLAEDHAGNVFVSDRDARFVWKIDPSGNASIVAGTGFCADVNKGVPARMKAPESIFGSPEGLAVDEDGNLFLADSALNVIFKIDRDGWCTIFAGNLQAGYGGDGGPATAALLNKPYDVRLDSRHNLYIADVHNNAVRKIDQLGIITTVAGTGSPGFSGDGGPANKAQLKKPYGLLLDDQGCLLIADSENNRIRKVGPDGIITTVAGCGRQGYAGDGGPALDAQLNVPQSLALDEFGHLYIGDEHNHAIRSIARDGTVRTVIGNHGHGFDGDGHSAEAAQIADPENMLFRPDGSMLISARDNSRVRVITPDGRINTWAGRGPSYMHQYQP